MWDEHIQAMDERGHTRAARQVGMLQLASLVRRLVGNTTLQVGGLAANTAGLSSYVVRAVLCNYDGLAQLLHAMTPAQHRAFHDRCCGTNGCENSFGRYKCYLGRKPPAAEFADAGPKLMDQNELARMNPTERGFYVPSPAACPYIHHDDGEHSAANVLESWGHGRQGKLVPAPPPGASYVYELWRDRGSAACIKRMWRQRRKAISKAKGKGEGTVRSMHCDGRHIQAAGQWAASKQVAAAAEHVPDTGDEQPQVEQPPAEPQVEQPPARKRKRQAAPIPAVAAPAALQTPMQLAALGVEQAAQDAAPVAAPVAAVAEVSGTIAAPPRLQRWAQRVPVTCRTLNATFLPDLLVAGNKRCACIEEAAVEGEVSRMLTFGAFCEKADLAAYKKNKTHAVMLRVVEHLHADGTTCSEMGMGKYEKEVLGTKKRKHASV